MTIKSKDGMARGPVPYCQQQQQSFRVLRPN